jgi:hypothetical protein
VQVLRCSIVGWGGVGWGGVGWGGVGWGGVACDLALRLHH